MDTNTLVDEQINDGQKLVELLPQMGFEVTAAFWLKPSEIGQWYFYIVTPLVESEQLPGAYRRLHPLIRKMPETFSIDPLGIKLIGPTEKLARDILAVHRLVGPRKAPLRKVGNWLGNMSIEDAYLYPLPPGVTV